MMRDVARLKRHRVAMWLRMRNESVATVVGHVQPLVSVRCPRIRFVDAQKQRSVLLARICPQAKCTVDMHPGAIAVRKRNKVGEPIERSDVKVTCLKQDDGQRLRLLTQRFFQSCCLELAGAIDRQGVYRVRAEPEEA